ncbi:MAG: hypothetical protein WBP11_13035 [Dokdonella sp.]
MSTMKHLIIGAIFAVAGSAIAAQARVAAEANDNSATSQPKSEYTFRARPNDHEQIIATGLIGDVPAFYAERGIELSDLVREGAPNNPPPMPPSPQPDTIPKLAGAYANSVDLVTFHIVIGKWDRMTRYARKASSADQSLAAAPWKLMCDGAFYAIPDRGSRTLNPEHCAFEKSQTDESHAQ